MKYPDVAHLTFSVIHRGTDTKWFVAFASIPVLALRRGFRTVLLYSEKGARMGEMVYASLFVRISIENEINSD